MPEADQAHFEISIICGTCGGTVHLGDKACSKCGRKVTKDEAAALRRRWEASDREAEKRSDETYWGKVALAIAAGSTTLMATLAFGNNRPFVPAFVAAAVAAFFWGLFLASFRFPLAATAIAAGSYCLLWAFEIVFSPLHGIDGYLVRALVISALIGAALAEWRTKRKVAEMVTARSGKAAG